MEGCGCGAWSSRLTRWYVKRCFVILSVYVCIFFAVGVACLCVLLLVFHSLFFFSHLTPHTHPPETFYKNPIILSSLLSIILFFYFHLLNPKTSNLHTLPPPPPAHPLKSQRRLNQNILTSRRFIPSLRRK